MVEQQRTPSALKIVVDGVTTPLTGKDEFVIGRGRDADVRVAGDEVGRRHVVVRRTPVGWELADLASLNGMWRDGRRVESVPLPPGAVTVHLGGPDGVPVTLVVDPPATDADALPGTVRQYPPGQRPGQPPVPPPGTPPGHRPPAGPPSGPQAPLQAAGPAGPRPHQGPPQPYPAPPQPYPGPPQPYPGPPQPYPGPPQPYQGPPQPYQAPPQTWHPTHPTGPGGMPQAPPGAPAGMPPGRPVPPSGPFTGPVPPPSGAFPGPVPTRPGQRLAAMHPLRPGALGIGRAQSNVIVLDDLLVSRHHAQIEFSAPGAPIRVTDLGSANGTFVNGQKIGAPTVVAVGGVFTVGPNRLEYDGRQILEYDEAEGVSFGAANLSVVVDGKKQLLHDVSFSLRPRTLMAVVGPSGAGKSTLLHALAGLRPATSGTVLYEGRDLYAEYEDLSQRIGFVPQQDILHQVLTVEQALEYGAQLRFPAETTKQERRGRIKEVAAELSLTNQLDTKVSRLSGGERKRASTAMELLTKPSLLFLDEPTSGLDTDLDREVMRLLRQLADDGRTVMVVTHNLDYLDVCDLVLVLARGGHAAYLGPPQDAFAHFGVGSWADLFAALKTREPAEWGQIFAARRDRDPRSFAPTLDQVGQTPSHLPPIRRQSAFSQWATLTKRYLRIIAADRTLLGILVVLPVILAGIARVVPRTQGLAHHRGNFDAQQILLVLVIGACLTGSAGAVRELVKERPIYLRERSVGLSWAAYLASKVVVVTTIAAVQGVVLTWLALLGAPTAEDPLVFGNATVEIAVVVALTTAVSALLGLAISAAVSDENQAMPLLVLASMAQLVMCGGLVPLVGRAVLEQASWLLPARWGFGAAAATVDLALLKRDRDVDPLWEHTALTWFGNMFVLLVLGGVCIGITIWLLKRLDPRRN